MSAWELGPTNRPTSRRGQALSSDCRAARSGVHPGGAWRRQELPLVDDSVRAAMTMMTAQPWTDVNPAVSRSSRG